MRHHHLISHIFATDRTSDYALIRGWSAAAHRRAPFILALACAALALVVGSAAKAELVLDNVPSAAGEVTRRVTRTTQVAQAFQTSAGSWTLDSFGISIATTRNSKGFLRLSLHENSGSDRPGDLLTILDGPAAPSTGFSIYTPSSALTLSGDTIYWVVVSITATSGTHEYDIRGTTNETLDTAVWSIPTFPTVPVPVTSGAFYSNDSGGSWLPDSRRVFSVQATQATAVPEPGTWAAAALLVGGAVFVRWRQHGKNRLTKVPRASGRRKAA